MRRAISFLLFWFLFAVFLAGLFVITWWYWNVRSGPVDIQLKRSSLSSPRDPIVLRFSQAVQPSSLDNTVRIEPAHPLRIEWREEDHVLQLIPETDWPLESKYQVSLASGKTKWFGTTPKVIFRIEGPRYPEVSQITPAENEQDVLLGIEDPIRITFDRSVKDFFIDFRFDPPAEVVYENNPDKTEFSLLPKQPLQEGKQYTLSLYAKWRGSPDTSYQYLTKTNFTTLLPKQKNLEQDIGSRVMQAKEVTFAKKNTGKYIDVNLSNQVMTLFENGEVVDAYLISSGKRGMDTPKGEFSVQNKAPRPWSRQYGLYMPYWQAITPDGKYGIHELPEWPGGYKEGANHLGTPVSHGCVRLGVGAAERVYAWSDIGTPIIIY
jgi:lipoprotein-anchoring transpeptidase ErfK/SrfK